MARSLQSIKQRSIPELQVEGRSSVITAEYFKSSLVSLLAEDKESSCTILLVGMDHFKALNESLGHAIGDKVLELVAKRILTLC